MGSILLETVVLSLVDRQCTQTIHNSLYTIRNKSFCESYASKTRFCNSPAERQRAPERPEGDVNPVTYQVPMTSWVCSGHSFREVSLQDAPEQSLIQCWSTDWLAIGRPSTGLK